jgi:hypothetical protein
MKKFACLNLPTSHDLNVFWGQHAKTHTRRRKLIWQLFCSILKFQQSTYISKFEEIR